MAERGKQFRSQFRFTLGDKTYEYRGYLSAADALLIKQRAGLGALEMFAALSIGDPAALVALVFVAKRQAGENVTWEEVVAQIDGDDDIWALFDSLEPIKEDEAPARRTRTKKEPAPPAA